MEVRIEKIGMGTKPDPYKYHIIDWEIVAGHTIILAEYHGCTTFNGQKLMLLEGEHTEFETLDPHFFEGHPIVARFRPDGLGWHLAEQAAKALAAYDY